MSSTYIPADLRRAVVGRAGGRCEYCWIAEPDTILGCEVDHIIAEKHGGVTDGDNLAFSCVICNKAKGSDIGSMDPESDNFVRFFNPRQDRWGDHFRLIDSRIEPQSPVGRVTARILGFDRGEQTRVRAILFRAGRYPPPETVPRSGPA